MINLISQKSFTPSQVFYPTFDDFKEQSPKTCLLKLFDQPSFLYGMQMFCLHLMLKKGQLTK
eukprot:UN17884